jgi:hypothetical protein
LSEILEKPGQHVRPVHPGPGHDCLLDVVPGEFLLIGPDRIGRFEVRDQLQDQGLQGTFNSVTGQVHRIEVVLTPEKELRRSETLMGRLLELTARQ